MRILIAEDDVTSRTILTGILTKWGYDPLPVNDGGAAWEALQALDAPKLAILDWTMPQLDGIEVCRRIREIDTLDPPYIIILTSKDEKKDIVRGLDAGGNDYVCKPYDAAELHARIKVGQKMIALQTSLNRAKETMAHLAMHDPLTGVLNRRAILDTVAREISRSKRSSATLSVGMLDIDHFKKVNDGHGHQVGDDVLCEVVRCIQSNLRDYDQVGRYGGEEFLVVAPGSTGSPAESLYQRLCAGVAKNPIETRAGSLRVTVSLGVAGGKGFSTVDEMLAAADAALYQAKDEGRNRVVYATGKSEGAI